MNHLKITLWVMCPVMAAAQPRIPISPLYSYSAALNNPAMAAMDGKNNISLLGSSGWEYKLAALSFETKMPENSGVLSGVASYMESGFEYMNAARLGYAYVLSSDAYNTKLCLGFSAGLAQLRYLGYPLLSNTTQSEFSIGGAITGKKAYLSVGLQHLNQPSFTFERSYPNNEKILYTRPYYMETILQMGIKLGRQDLPLRWQLDNLVYIRDFVYAMPTISAWYKDKRMLGCSFLVYQPHYPTNTTQNITGLLASLIGPQAGVCFHQFRAVASASVYWNSAQLSYRF